MPLVKAEEYIEACVYNKIDNRKTRRIFYETNLELKKREVEIVSKNIPLDRRLERIQITSRLRDKLEKKKKKSL